MKAPAYYNEHDKFAAQWLRNLIAAGHIAPGDVDERSGTVFGDCSMNQHTEAEVREMADYFLNRAKHGATAAKITTASVGEMLRAYADRLAADEAAWQPIATAPTDGTVVLGRLTDSDVPHSVRYQDGRWVIVWDGSHLSPHDGPTHWSPLYTHPAAPQPLPWYEGSPPFPQDQEWFIAETIYGDRVVLRSLDEGREHRGNYAFKTADGTYMKAEIVKRWMQFPDCEYLPPAAPQVPEELRQAISYAVSILNCDARESAVAGNADVAEMQIDMAGRLQSLLTPERPAPQPPGNAAAAVQVDSWPILSAPATVGGINFHAGVSSRLVVEAAQRHHANPVRVADVKQGREEMARLIGESAARVEERVARDAARYRLLSRGQQWSVVDGIGDALRADELDAALDAAIAAEAGVEA
ncbi:hypothetical protein [Chitiniphilus eburneus]|uniref:hypothetical protein n=1 Tax=Chitiniphilus eburneus TaxID=2571148 RepID=UPI001B7FD83E|nr:hypothetical protein [Chitiniphilus eburneus]